MCEIGLKVPAGNVSDVILILLSVLGSECVYESVALGVEFDPILGRDTSKLLNPVAVPRPLMVETIIPEI